MTDAVLVALISFGGVLVTTGPNYLAHRKTRRQQAETVDSAVTAAIAPVSNRVSHIAARLDEMAGDVADIRVSVAVHEDRWTRPTILRPVTEGRIPPEIRG
ncbi:MAG TPA: hypothetical protein VM677_27965 [Actinokineospora sp.]|jgi:hypothetical protein|nr:hypothetical protein [Actinokineospora sp.]